MGHAPWCDHTCPNPRSVDDPEKVKRTKKMAWFYILHKGATYRAVAEKYGVSESTANKYLNKDLPQISAFLYKWVRWRAEKNKALSLEKIKASAKERVNK